MMVEELDTDFHRFYSEVRNTCKSGEPHAKSILLGLWYFPSTEHFLNIPRSTGITMMKFGIIMKHDKSVSTNWITCWKAPAMSTPTTVSGTTQPPKSKLSALPAPAQLP